MFQIELKMRELVKDLPNQLKDALKVSKEMRITPSENDIYNIVICGLGGSGIGGSIVQSIVQDEMKLPIITVNTYDIPEFVSPNTLVICSSFSGNTEETVSAYHQAKDKGAKVCCITSGGKIRFLADTNEDDLAILPNHISSPRANIGYSVVQLLHVLEAYSYISDSFKIEIENAYNLLEKQSENIQAKAKEIASSYKDKLPIIYSDDRFYSVAIRSQQQINENGKHICHVNKFPEFNHNELVGWEFPKKTYHDAVVTYLMTDFDHPRVDLRMNICKSIFEDRANKVIEIKAKGTSFIEQVYYIIHLFDYISCDLADVNNVEATPVEIIDYLKESLDKIK